MARTEINLPAERFTEAPTIYTLKDAAGIFQPLSLLKKTRRFYYFLDRFGRVKQMTPETVLTLLEEDGAKRDTPKVRSAVNPNMPLKAYCIVQIWGDTQILVTGGASGNAVIYDYTDVEEHIKMLTANSRYDDIRYVKVQVF